MKKGTDRPAKKKPKRARAVTDDEILPEYDFTRAGPNRFAREYVSGANVVSLVPTLPPFSLMPNL
jgi:hypothetical protein